MNYESTPRQTIDWDGPEHPKPKSTPRFALIGRLLGGALFLVIASSMAFALWVMGMLFFAFAMDGFQGTQLPQSIEWVLLWGWPAAVSLVAVVPTIFLLTGKRWSLVLLSLVGTIVLSFLTWMLIFAWVIFQLS